MRLEFENVKFDRNAIVEKVESKLSTRQG